MTPDSGHEPATLLNALVDNELDAASAARVAAHLDTCAACRAVFDSLRDAARVVHDDADYFDPPEGLAERLFPSASESRPAAAPRGRIIRLVRNYLAPVVSLTALAASLMLYIAAPGSSPSLDDEAVSDHIRSLMGEHLIDVVSSDHHTVKPWFAGKLDFSPPVADFAGDGFALIGGRIDYLQHRDAAVLIYRHGKHVINVFIYPETGGTDAIVASHERGYNVLSWSRDALHVVAVSDMDAAELQRLGELLRKP